MPEAHAILWFLGTFLALWGITLIVRGAVGERRGPGRQCPSCNAALAAGTLTCASCGFDAPDERCVRSRQRSWPMVMSGVGAQALAAAAFVAGERVYVWSHRDPGLAPGLSLWACAALGTLAFSVVLIAWAVVGDRSRGRRRCPRCWYDMAGNTGLRCPECGHECGHARQLYGARRRWRLAPVGVAGLLVAAGLWEVPRYRAGGPVALLPTTALIAGLWQLPDSCIIEDRTGTWPEDWALVSRLGQGRVASWQQSWLVSRVEAVLRAPDTPERYARASALRGRWWTHRGRDTWSDDLGRSAERAFVRWISGPDADLRTRAAASFQSLFWGRHYRAGLRLEPAEFDAYVPGLRAAMAGGGVAAQCAACILAHIPAQHAAVIEFVEADARSWAGGPSYHAFIFDQVSRTGSARLAREATTRLMAGETPNERRLAINVLHRVFAEDPTSLDQIRALLNDPDDSVARSAFWTVLSDSGRATLSPELVNAILARPTPAGRLQLLSFLQGGGVTIAVADLAFMLESEQDGAVQATLCRFIEQAASGGRDAASALRALRAAAKSQDATVAQEAVAAISAIESRARATPPP